MERNPVMYNVRRIYKKIQKHVLRILREGISQSLNSSYLNHSPNC